MASQEHDGTSAGGFPPNQLVEITGGRFQGLPAVILDPSDVALLLEAINAERPADIKAPEGQIWVAVAYYGRVVPVKVEIGDLKPKN